MRLLLALAVWMTLWATPLEAADFNLESATIEDINKAFDAERKAKGPSVTGLPALLVPAGYTAKENGPIAIEFLGRPFSEPVLFRLAFAYEQQSKNRKTPASTPPLPAEHLTY